jgi:hypothetical protein
MAQRNFIKQLPVVQQTTTLQKFFNATVDQVFQPGQLQNVNAYIGRKPSYYNQKTDFYKPEYDAERAFYQLEPAMVSTDSSDTTQNLLFYVDIVNNLRYQGALVDNHQRLFETDYYTWCPPINLDMLDNYRNYYWLPDGPPIMTFAIPVNTYTGDGTTTVFAAPVSLPNSIVNVKVKVQGVYATNFTYTVVNGVGEVTFQSAPASGSKIQIWTNGEFEANIDGKTAYTYPGVATAYASEQRTISQTVESDVLWDTEPWSTNDMITWEIQASLETQTGMFNFPTIDLDPSPALVRGMLVEIQDDTWDNNWDVMLWDIDLWDTKVAKEVNVQKQNGQMVVEMIDQDPKMVHRTVPQYWTIERRSISENQWSLNNRWYHSSIIFYDGNGYAPAKATRPIIEFFNSLKLFNYGVNRLDNVDLVYEGVNINVAGLPVGKKILIVNSANPSVSDGMYYVSAPGGTPTLVSLITPKQYDTVEATNGVEYWFNGTKWVKAQAYGDQPPLFDLFDRNSTSLADPTIYPTSTFAGSEIFAYSHDTTGTTPIDSVLGFAPVYNQYGSFEYDNKLNIDGSAVPGLKYFALESINNGIVTFDYESAWRYAGQTQQPIDSATGFYSIPQNLQANPNNDDITTISRNDWYPQFQQILPENNWLWDSKYYTLTSGTNIVQNRDNLLKTMLMSSNKNIDVMKSMLYVEREYSRYRAKLVQYLTTMYTRGQIIDASSALTTALNYLKVTKTSSFAFFNNGMGGDNYYIPASGAYLGLTPLWKPEFIIQNSSTGGAAVMLRGHDGSLLPGFTKFATQNVSLTTQGVMVDGVEEELDIRDTVMMAYEQLLFNSCDASLQEQRRPAFDLKSVQPGKFRTTEYSVGEFNQVATPIFERWVARGQKDYTSNKIYDPNNTWTWNYKQLRDADGQSIPGYWRGIYRYYYDTDRPDTHPWEMLGYTSKPTWWDTYYSWTDSAKRTALIAAIVAGNVEQPPSVTIDPIFARADFARFIPVDTNGNLLDPFQAGIVVDTGNVTAYDQDWVFGDCGPVENSWWNSEYISFTLSELGYLLKPVRFIDTGWQTLDNQLVYPGQSNQWISKTLGRRPHFSDFTVHNEVVDKAPVRVVGFQQWISDYVRSNGQDITTTFGNHVRGLQVKLAHKIGAFTDSKTMQASTESQGVLPSENVTVQLYNSPSTREEFYSGVIIKWNGAGWVVIGYDVLDPVFSILPVDTNASKVKISLGALPAPAYPWLPNTFYQTGVQVTWQNATYSCIKSHTSVGIFEQEYWQLESSFAGASPSLDFYTSAQPNASVQTIPYGSVFYTMQEVCNFLAGYELYLKSRGWVFDQFDSSINENKDFRLAVRQFLNWAQVAWAPGTFITLSPLSDGVKFVTDHGAIQSVEQMVNGVYSILDRAGAYVDIKNTVVNRINGQIVVSTKDTTGIFGLRLCVSEIEHCVLFDNTTIFNDVIYQPLFNLRQNRIRMNFNLSTNWNGTLNAPGFVLTDNLMIPSFDRSVEDVRNMFSIEKPVYSVMRDYARHQIGYQSRSYLADIFTNELNQFEFYQGMIQQKGSAGALDKLLRNTTLTQTTNLEFLEEWAFLNGNYGGVSQENIVEFELTSDDIKQEPQQINFIDGTEGLTADQLTALQDPDSITLDLYSNSTAHDTRWIYPINTNTVFPTILDYTRHKGDLPTAGYVRIDEVTASAPSLASLNAMVQAGTVSLAVGNNVWIYNNGTSTFDVLRVDTALNGTGLNGLVTQNYISSITGNTIVMEYPTTFVVGDHLYISSPSNTSPDIGGVYTVSAVASDGVTITLAETITVSNTFSSQTTFPNTTIPEPGVDAPVVLRLFSMRFNEKHGGSMVSYMTQNSLSANFCSAVIVPSGGFTTNDYIYLDTGYEFALQSAYAAYQKRWAVFKWNGSEFVRYRSQAPRIDRKLIDSMKIYDTVTSLSSDSNLMQANPLLYPDVVPYDPVQGLIPGAAMREVYYMQEYDPARYNQGGSNVLALGMEWDESQVGRIWWNLDSTRFLLAETNDLTNLDSVDASTELKYRVKNWGSLAPNSEVDFYEWTESAVNPIDWMANFNAGSTPTIYDGPVFNSTNPSWVEKQVFDPSTGTYVTKFYFWVKNRQTTPNVPFRSISASAAAQIIANPANNGIAWAAPIASNAMIVAALSQYLTPTSSLQIRIRKNDAKVGKHSEWSLLRPGDPLSLPSVTLFSNMVSSIAGFNAENEPIPNPSLYVTTRVGNNLRVGQSWFKNLQGARKHLVEYLNNVFANLLLADDRPYALTALQKTHSDDQYLQWTQTQGSAYIEPIPNKALWKKQFASLQEFTNAYTKDPSVSPGLIMNLSGKTPFWSVMTEDTQGDINFATLWDKQVSSLTELNALIGQVADGTKVLVAANSATANMWTLWIYNSSTASFQLVTTQRYNTNDIFTIVDWYASGYDATMVPSAVYQNQAARQVALGANPTIHYTKINDDGQGRWMWQVWNDGVWTTVAKENGTIQLNDNIWQNTGNVFDVTGTLPSNFATLVANRDMGYELNYVLNALRDSVLLAEEQNELFFSMISYLHTEQDFVDWCFKTSFMYVQGFNANLIASPIASIDYTADLLSYINEVKPYHVKIRNFISKYGVSDTANVHATDFDKPVYFDSTQGKYRILDETNVADLAILASDPSYKDWYNNWVSGNNQVRKIVATLTFDRVSMLPSNGWDNEAWDIFDFDSYSGVGGAVDRLSQYWSGDATSQTGLMGVMKGTVFNGPVLGSNLASPTLYPTALTFVEDGKGHLIGTNLPSYVYFAQKFDTIGHLLPAPWDVANDNQPNYVWDQMNTTTWDALNQTTWNHLVQAGLNGQIYNAYEFEFTATQFDVNNGHRLEVYRNNKRLSLINGDYIVLADPNLANSWKIYFKMSDLGPYDNVVIMLVAADAPTEIIDGGIFANSTYSQIISGSIFQDPTHQANHPEELVQVLVTAGVRIKMHQTWTPGSASITLYESASPMTLPVAPQSKQAIALYDGGVRVAQNDYTYDARSLIVNYTGNDNPTFLDSVSFGFGGANQITGTDYFNGDGTTTTFPIDAVVDNPSDLFVTVDGVLNTAFSVNNNKLTFTTAPANGSFIKVVVMPSIVDANNNPMSGFNTVTVKEIDLTTLGGPLTFEAAFGLSTPPNPIQSIIEVDGLRVLSTGIYEAFVSPGNEILQLGQGVQYANLTATFNGSPIVIGTDVVQSFTIPASTRSVNLGSNWAASDMVVKNNGVVQVVGEVVGTAPGYPLSNLNPDAPELNSMTGVYWDQDLWDGVSLWDDPNQYLKYTIAPANATLVVYEGRLMSLNPLAADLTVTISFGNTIPNDLTNYSWDVPGQPGAVAQAIMMGDQIMMLGDVTGDLVVFDSAQADFNFTDPIAQQFPLAKRMTLTTFANANVMGIHTVSYDHITDNWFPIPGSFPTPGSLWVTLNGRKLREGADFYVTPANNGWDIPAWDTDARDEMSPFGPNSFAVRMNEENGIFANPGDHVIISTFTATQAQIPYDQIIYLDPLREYGISDISKITTHSDYYTLASDIDINTSNIVLQRVNGDGLPSIGSFDVDRNLHNPGVMMLNKEIVRFLQAKVDTNANTITLIDVERGYRGSSIFEHTQGETVIDLSQDSY